MIDIFFVIFGLVIVVWGAVSLMRSYFEVERYAKSMTDELSAAAVYAVGKARKIVILVVGVTLLAAGVAMMILPGPATVVIPLGLAVLGTEFVWARRLLKYILDEAQAAVHHLTGRQENKEQ